MSTKNTGSHAKNKLRNQAEQIARKKAVRIADNPSPEEEQELLHELRVHQIELEMQNEELRIAQFELEASRDRYKDLYDFSPVAYFTLDKKEVIREANLTATVMLGMACSDLIKKPLYQFILRDDQDIHYHHRRNLLETGKPQSCDLRMVKKDGMIFWARMETTISRDAGNAAISRVTLSDITQRKFQEDERELKANLVALFDTPEDFRERMAALTDYLQSCSGCEAVGIRLRAGADYPYYETRGFSPGFVHEENHLCAFDQDGEILRDHTSNPTLECMCGNVLNGRFDPTEPFFTVHGSFWSNNTTSLLSATTAANRQARTRNQCNAEWYESVALIPLRNNHQVFGLLQFNDHRPGRFSPDLIAHLERMADNLAIALSRQHIAKALRESEKLYHSLFDNMLNGCAYCRMLFAEENPRDFIYLAVNKAFFKLTGLQSVVGRKATEVIPGIREANPEIFEICGRVALTGQSEQFETFVEFLQMWLSVSVYSPVHEHFVTVFEVITKLKEKEKMQQEIHDALEIRVQERTSDLTLVNQQLSKEIKERHQAEERLRKSRKMLQTIFDGISDPLVLLDNDMRVRLLNKNAIKYYGLTEPRKAIGEFCYKAFKGESCLCKGCKIALAKQKTEDSDFERQGFMDPLREERVFLYPLNLKNGIPRKIICRVSDITERKVFEKRLIQNEKMASLGVLVSSIAHEINNPNAFINFNIPILKEYIEQMIEIIDQYSKTHPELELCNMSYPEFHKDIFSLISNIEHGSERICDFVSNLKEFSRIQYKGKEIWIDLTAVVEKAVSICRAKVKKMVTSFTVDIPADFERINTDPIALEQILINLLINAAQAADKEDSWIRLSVAMGHTWLNHTIIEVQDNGCGIEEKNMGHILDPFFSTKAQTEGTGLGLFVCHNLVTGLGGRIEVESKVGEFSIFRVMIPDIDRRKEERA